MQHEPYLFSTQNSNGEQEFSGFIPDIMFALSRRLHFNYKFYLIPDNKYGMYNNDTGTWDGMIGELIKNEVDIINLWDFYDKNNIIDNETK